MIRPVLAGVACVALLAACSSSGSGSSGSSSTSSSSTGSASGASGTTVDVKNFSFNPSALTVAKGATVTWKFDDSAKHNVTSSDGSFKSADESTGGTYTHSFNTAGTYNYICSIHQYMKATITVK